jgi:hypothetical protein
MSLLRMTRYGRIVFKTTKPLIICFFILGPAILSTCDPGVTLLSKSTGKEAVAIRYPEFKAEINSGFLIDGPVTIGIEIWTTEEIMIFPDRLHIEYGGRDISYDFTRDYKLIGNAPFHLDDSNCLLLYKCKGLHMKKMDEIRISADNFFLKGDNYYDIDTVTFFSPKDFL